MLLITCPWCGPRAEVEFRNGGQAHIARPSDPGTLDDEAWAAHLYLRGNPRGLHAERWIHQHGCQRWFNAIRDTVTDAFVETYRSGERPTSETGLALLRATPQEPA
jgi:sarcosine oxidase subunit delta